MSGTSKKISELTTATVLDGSELIVVVQDTETRQSVVSALAIFAPVQSVNMLTGDVELAISNIIGVEGIVATGAVSAGIAAVSVRVDEVSALVSSNTVLINDVSAAVVSVQNYLLSQLSVATSGGILEAPLDGQIYGRGGGNWVPVSVTAMQTQINDVSALVAAVSALVSTVSAIAQNPEVSGSTTNVIYIRKNADWIPLVLAYDVGFDFGVSTVPAGEYAKVVAARTFYILPSCSGSRIAYNTSAFPTVTVSIPIMFPTSTTLGVLVIGVSGTATWPAITTTSVSIGQTFGVQTSVSSDATLTGLAITFAGYYRP